MKTDREMVEFYLKCGGPFIYDSKNNELQHFYPPLPWTGPDHNPELLKVILSCIDDGQASWKRGQFFQNSNKTSLMIIKLNYDLMKDPIDEDLLAEDKKVIAEFNKYK